MCFHLYFNGQLRSGKIKVKQITKCLFNSLHLSEAFSLVCYAHFIDSPTPNA